MNTNLKEISNFIKKNNSYSDFNLVNNFLLNLNFTKINFNKNLRGGLGNGDNNFSQPYMNNPNLPPPDMMTNNNLPPYMTNNNLPPSDMMTNNNLPPDMMMTNNNLLPQDMITTNNLPQDMMTNNNLLPQDMITNNNLPQDMMTNNNLLPQDMMTNNNLLPQDMMTNNNLLPQDMMMTNNNLLPPDMMTNNNLPNQMSNIQKLPDMYLQNPSYTTDRLDTYTIKEGTILYHATSNKKGFNTNYINLGDDKLINFFTPNFRLASDKIEGCSVDKQNGYIHVFRVVKDIPNIYVRLPYDIADDINSGLLANEFCSKNQNYYGIGFFYPKNNIEMFSNNIYQQSQTNILYNPEQYYSEFGLCNPKPYLEYLYSQRCQSLRKLSEPYRFN